MGGGLVEVIITHGSVCEGQPVPEPSFAQRYRTSGIGKNQRVLERSDEISPHVLSGLQTKVHLVPTTIFTFYAKWKV